MSLLPHKCKCPFDHHEISNPNPPAQGSETYPDYHSFDTAVEPEKFELNADNNYTIELFKKFLRIPSITGDCPTGQADKCTQFFSELCTRWGIESWTMEFTPKYPIFIAKIPGSDDSLPAVLLNSHYDVVPVVAKKWVYPPFDAVELDNGDIVARGAQDMKCVCIHHFVSVIQLLRKKAQEQGVETTLDDNECENKKKIGQMKLLKRTVYLAVMPDEELGGTKGMAEWVKAEVSDKERNLIAFRDMNIGFTLDEGLASTERNIIAFYGERSVWWLELRAVGPTGHASRFIEGTATEKIICSVNQLLSFRDDEYKRLHGLHPELTQDIGCAHAKALQLGDVVTLNLTMLEAGVKAGDIYSYNVVPTDAKAGFDFRLPPDLDLVEFEKKLRAMLPDGVSINFVVKTEVNNPSPHTSEDKYWAALMKGCEPHGIDIKATVFPSAVDGRYIRNLLNKPVVGFSPLFNQPMMLHDHDERLNKWIFIKGLFIMTDVLEELTKLD